MLCKQNDLPNVISVMSELPVDRLDNRMRLAADGDRSCKVIKCERLDCLEERLPSGFPKIHQAVACVVDQFEFRVAVPIRLLAVGR